VFSDAHEGLRRAGGHARRHDLTAVLRLLGAMLQEQDDEWKDNQRYFSIASMELLKAVPSPENRAPGTGSRSEDGRRVG